jgi:hypothetical protein
MEMTGEIGSRKVQATSRYGRTAKSKKLSSTYNRVTREQVVPISSLRTPPELKRLLPQEQTIYRSHLGPMRIARHCPSAARAVLDL